MPGRPLRPLPCFRRPGSGGWWLWRGHPSPGRGRGGNTLPAPCRAGPDSPPPPSPEVAGPGWPPLLHRTGGRPPCQLSGSPAAQGTTHTAHVSVYPGRPAQGGVATPLGPVGVRHWGPPPYLLRWSPGSGPPPPLEFLGARHRRPQPFLQGRSPGPGPPPPLDCLGARPRRAPPILQGRSPGPGLLPRCRQSAASRVPEPRGRRHSFRGSRRAGALLLLLQVVFHR